MKHPDVILQFVVVAVYVGIIILITTKVPTRKIKDITDDKKRMQASRTWALIITGVGVAAYGMIYCLGNRGGVILNTFGQFVVIWTALVAAMYLPWGY